MTLQEKLNQLGNYTSQLLRKNFGRGPESCYATFRTPFVIFYIRGFLSPMEEVLLKQGHSDTIDVSRSIVIESLLPELKGVIQVTLETEIREFYHDWNFPNNTGIIAAVMDPTSSQVEPLDDGFPVQEKLEYEITRISHMVEKTPDKIESFQISPKLYVVMRTGILVPVEKALVAKGYQQILAVTKDEMEKASFHRDGVFEEVFQQQVADIFVDWNVKEDKSLMCFVLK
ncbi:DUF2294 domain-containing protein [Fodinisporobacter ferrooxydans]|uniref:DUF2294 domain-containing protein n=1 Tax=Fodinisporobacter ferrooxydans TaxID=2901836 RepID=A0ABY4CMD8_9BACL|nr:DUF2294 domain-containing protein [Alicyclobacillaceae bacterium MYW30-H2]